ncbi:WD40-repeat-containing domain protein [Ochromonadaceae sp. CCMP2298]|nr:WD40-repeat-containing domain protein [Ochromonadaceae sp. CCMP2298]
MSYACFRGHSDSVYCAAIHPSQPGVVLTGGGDDVAYLWRYKQSQEDSENPTPGEAYSPIQLTGHTDTVTSVGFNFNGSLALTGAYDGTVRIWQVETGALVQVLEGPEDVEWAQWHNKGNAIIAGSRDGTVWMWLTHNGQCVHVFAGHDGGVACGLFSQDGKSICTGGEDGTVRQWQPKTGACRHVFAGGAAMGGTGMGHEAEVTCLAGSADGDLVLSGEPVGASRNLKRIKTSFGHGLLMITHSIKLYTC